MAFNYNGIQARAKALLANYGEPLEFRLRVTETYDPVSGIEEIEYLNSYRYAVCLPSVESGLKFFDDSFLAGMIVGKTKVFIVSGSGEDFEPLVGSQIFYEGKLWDVGTEDINTGVMPLSPRSGSNIIFTIGCRLSGQDPDEGLGIGSLSKISSEENRLRVFVNETFYEDMQGIYARS